MSPPPPSSRPLIESDQLDRLRTLLRTLLGRNRFYTPRLQSAGLTDPDRVTLDDFRRLPFTFKPELADDQLANPPYGSTLTYPLDHYTRFHQTSGTTAAPLRWLDTPASWSALLDCWQRVYEAAGVTANDRVFFAFSFGPFLGFWTAHDAAARMGCLCIPGGGLSSAARLRMILDNRATVLCCTPTYALRLAEVAAAERIDLNLSAVRRIIVAGEPGGSIPAVRDRIEAAWPGARVVDHHGMTEVGPVTFEHPRYPRRPRHRGALVVIESAYLAEVIDPATGEPAAPGDTGELVLTTLARTASPLLRYRTGDLVRPIYLNDAGEPDNTNGALALDGGILARVDDMVIVRGVNVYPSAIDDAVRRDPRISEYRVTVRDSTSGGGGGGGMTELAIDIESDDPSAARDLEASLRDALSLRVPVKLAAPGSLPASR